MNNTQLKLLTMQSAFHKDCNTIIDLIAPIICDKKITKREIDKANLAIFAKFGEYVAYKDDHNEPVFVPHFTLSLQIDAWSRKLKIYKHDRAISHDGITNYMYESDRTIYLENDGTITNEELQRHKVNSEYMPTEKQIVTAEKQYRLLEDKIKKLEDKKSSLPFHYYFNK